LQKTVLDEVELREIRESTPLELILLQEAKRINTPPMEVGTPEIHARGFFFDLGSAKEGTSSPSESGAPSQHSGGSGSNKGKSKQTHSRPSSLGSNPTIEWWEADTKHPSTGNKSTDRLKVPNNRSNMPGLPTQFEIELPEHLPNSPLCPKHPLHKSGGTGICVYHGRRRSVRLKNLKRVDTQDSGDKLN
jgi:parafibromin